MNKLVRNYLIELSRQKSNQTVTYQKLSNDCNLGLNMQGNPSDRTYIGEILGAISEFEVLQIKKCIKFWSDKDNYHEFIII